MLSKQIRSLFLVFLLCSIVSAASAQSADSSRIVVNGKVMQEDGQPLVGVTVTTIKEGRSSISNEQGNYSISVRLNDSLFL